MAAAALVGAVAERAQQIGLRAPDQTNARPPRNRKPLFQRQPAGKATFAFGHGCSLILPPRDSGEGRAIRSSRSARKMVGGGGGAGPDNSLQPQQTVESEAPSTMLRLRSHGPPPPLSRGRIILPRSRGAP